MTLIIITKRGRSLTKMFQFTLERHVANNSVAVWAPFSQAWKVFQERHHTTLNCLRKLIFLLLEAIFLAKRVYNLVARASREPRVVLARYKIRCAINKSFFLWIYAWCQPVTSCSVTSWTFRVSRQHKLCRWWLDYEQSLFFLGPSSKTLVTRKWPRVTEGARGKFLLGLPPSFLASRGFAASRTRECAIPLLNLKKKRDCLQSTDDQRCLQSVNQKQFPIQITQDNKHNKWLEILDFQPKLFWRRPTKIHRELRIRRQQEAARKARRTLLSTAKATSSTQRPQTCTEAATKYDNYTANGADEEREHLLPTVQKVMGISGIAYSLQ